MKHVDVYIPAATAADATNADGTIIVGVNSVLLFDPGNRGWICRNLMIGAGAAMRVVVGTSDTQGQRIRAGTFTAGGGAGPDCCVEGAQGQRVYVLRDAAGPLDVQADFDLTP